MNALTFIRAGKNGNRFAFKIGTTGYLAIVVWTLAMVLLAPAAMTPPIAVVCLVIITRIFQVSLKQLWRPRLMWMIVLLTLPPVFFSEPDLHLWIIPVSYQGMLTGLQMLLRTVVILAAVNGLTNAVDISSIAGLFESIGLHGLGFSLGVALNLLPALQQSYRNAWYSMKMRGGLRRNRRLGLRLLALTIITNALRRAEDIALAAEARAFSPECCRAMPVKRGNLDWPIAAGSLASIIALCVTGF